MIFNALDAPNRRWGSRLLNMHIPRGRGLIHLPLLPRPITKQNKGCVKLWPYNLHFKNYVKAKRRIMEVTQIFHHGKKIKSSKKSIKKKPKTFKILLL
jgi:hypothetical protein